MKDTSTLRIGDTVIWRGGWGKQSPQEATISGLNLTACPLSKDTIESLDSVAWSLVEENRVLVDLDNGHWAYGYQIALYE